MIDNINTKTLRQAMKFYFDVGLYPIPIVPQSKIALKEGWPERETEDLWLDAPDNANIGLRCGGNINFAVIDADEKNKKGSVEFIRDYLSELKIFPPEIKTINGDGRHFYLRLNNPHDGSARNFNESKLAGEFRYGNGAYVIAPPSSVTGKKYELISGDLNKIPIVTWDQIEPLLRPERRSLLPKTTEKIINLSDIDEGVIQIPMYQIPFAAKEMVSGKGIENFNSTSHFEYRIIQILVQNGFGFHQIYSIFETYPCGGKYRNKKKYKLQWLNVQYRTALEVETSIPSIFAGLLAEVISNVTFAGTTGKSEKAVLLANLEIIRRIGQFEYGLSVREISEIARVNKITASKVQKKITKYGWIHLIEKKVVNDLDDLSRSYRYELDFIKIVDDLLLKIKKTNNSTVHNGGGGEDCTIVGLFGQNINHDIFERQGLGKEGELVYRALISHGSLTATEIAEITGLNIKTVRKKLEAMSSFEPEGDNFVTFKMAHHKWGIRPAPRLLDLLAEYYGVEGKDVERGKIHRNQRERFFKYLERIKH